MLRRVFKVNVPNVGWLAIVPTLNRVYLFNPSEKIPEYIKDETNGNEEEILTKGFVSDFSYSSVMLLLTTRCNLRCVYCYSNAGDTESTIPWEVIGDSVKFVIQNALIKGNEAWIRFHGGGEPTLAWSRLVKSVEYARHLSSDKVLVRFSITTNGVVNQKQRDFLANNMDYINLSMDGPAEIQNVQRPLRDGGASFEKVLETAKFFYRNKVKFGIRSSITPHSATRMFDIVQFFGRNFPGIKLAVEPIDICGRCRQSGLNSYTIPKFAEMFLAAKKEAEQYDVQLRYSSVDIRRVSLSYCGTSASNFIITPEGYVTACSRVCRKNDPGAEAFIFGYHDRNTGHFVFDEKKHNYLQQIRVNNMPKCSDCFAAWLCKGDCPMQRYNFHNGEILEGVSSRCDEIKQILVAQLLQQLKNNPIKACCPGSVQKAFIFFLKC